MKWFLTIAVVLLSVGCGSPKPALPAAQPPAAPAQPTDTTKKAVPGDTTAAKSATQPQVAGMLKDTLVSTKLPDSLFFNIKVKDYGTMKIQLFTKDAPLNVTNVANLGIKGFYNGLTFHRLIPGFMIQGGDPAGNGTGGPGYTVAAEIKKPHTKGAMAMARLGDNVNPGKKSSGSQFYICFQPTPQLDGQYTVIGQVVDGMDVLAKLEQVKTGPMDKPLTPVVMEQVWVTNQ